MEVCRHKLTMYDFAVFRVCIRGMLDESWSDYFGTQSMSVEVDAEGDAVTTFTTEAVDQAALVGSTILIFGKVSRVLDWRQS